MHAKDVAKAINSPDLTVPLIPLQSWQKMKQQMQPADAREIREAGDGEGENGAALFRGGREP